MVTLFHTLLHFVTLFCTILSPTAALAASTSIQANSKSHFSAFTVQLCTQTHKFAYRVIPCSGAYAYMPF
jgi:hypothetical protein